MFHGAIIVHIALPSMERPARLSMPPPVVDTSKSVKEKNSTSSIPRFFFPRKRTPFTCGERIRRGRVAARLDAVILSSAEFTRLVEYICSFACDSRLSLDLKREMEHRAKKTGIVEVDRMLSMQMTLMLSYEDYCSVSKGSWCDSAGLRAKLGVLLSAQHFLMFPQNTQGRISGYTILEYLHQFQLSLRVARFVLERVAQEGADKDDETLSEEMYSSLITETIQASCHELALIEDMDFQQYYELICTRMLLLPHGMQQGRTRGLSINQIVACDRFAEFFRLMDNSLRNKYDQEVNSFHPSKIRLVHRQYLQLDRDGNGMLSIGELEDYGKKRAFNPTGYEPTHDLTDAFVTQVFAEVRTFNGEMDYHAYLDFTLVMNDRVSTAALRFFWRVLDFHKQGFLDAFTLDFYLRSLLEKIHAHEGKDDAPTIGRLRTQVFDAVAPAHPNRITWQDLQRCKLGHDVVRLVTDYVAYRTYEDSGGRFSTS
ncbi:hypothetical protein PR001_g14640 [Phytophthora rubi]|uniref:Uncharacterized protein n=1 Tax=Phytophthora rubi TaxID=129364 RepID=A0A6A3L0Y9_9STRA|nr:hypothetical protein PR002_g15046 [Phytophthora rubi]KAE9016489.1 hypothetical protein PR001_g14640 [Phytophthora rubi]